MRTAAASCVHCETPSSVVTMMPYKRLSCVQLQFSNLSSEVKLRSTIRGMGHNNTLLLHPIRGKRTRPV